MFLRLYSIVGCEHCMRAKRYLDNSGVPYEEVIPQNDPVIGTGLAVMFPGRPAQFPILVNFRDSSVTVGFREDDYARAVESCGFVRGTGLSHGGAAEQQPSGEASGMVEETAPEDK
jgi:hypothetical protein